MTKSKSRRQPRRRKTQASVARKINQLVEKKQVDTTNTYEMANDQTIKALTLLGQGTSSHTRSGLKIFAKKLYINGIIEWGGGKVVTGRMIIFYDKRPGGALPVVTDLLETAAVASQLNNKNEGRRFVVLYDKMFNNMSVDSTIGYEKGLKIRLNLNKTVWYQDGNATSASAGPNNYYMCLLSDASIASGDAPDFIHTTRLYYEDA